MMFMIFLSCVSDLDLFLATLKTNRLSNLSTPRDPRCSKAFLSRRKLKTIFEKCHLCWFLSCKSYKMSFVWNLATSPLCPRITLRAYSDKALRVNFGIEKVSGKQDGAPKTNMEASNDDPKNIICSSFLHHDLETLGALAACWEW